jgi:ethanolamine phosphate transferase 2 subunit G
MGAALTTAAVTFKLAFTNEDSPELLSGLAKSMADTDVGASLVTRARILFMSIGLAVIFTLVAGFSNSKRPNRGFTFILLYCCTNLPII